MAMLATARFCRLSWRGESTAVKGAATQSTKEATWRCGGLRGRLSLGYPRRMILRARTTPVASVTPSEVTRHAEMLRLCARIGYSPPGH
jgi:hypothetical protein